MSGARLVEALWRPVLGRERIALRHDRVNSGEREIMWRP